MVPDCLIDKEPEPKDDPVAPLLPVNPPPPPLVDPTPPVAVMVLDTVSD